MCNAGLGPGTGKGWLVLGWGIGQAGWIMGSGRAGGYFSFVRSGSGRLLEREQLLTPNAFLWVAVVCGLEPCIVDKSPLCI